MLSRYSDNDVNDHHHHPQAHPEIRQQRRSAAAAAASSSSRTSYAQEVDHSDDEYEDAESKDQQRHGQSHHGRFGSSRDARASAHHPQQEHKPPLRTSSEVGRGPSVPEDPRHDRKKKAPSSRTSRSASTDSEVSESGLAELKEEHESDICDTILFLQRDPYVDSVSEVPRLCSDWSELLVPTTEVLHGDEYAQTWPWNVANSKAPPWWPNTKNGKNFTFPYIPDGDDEWLCFSDRIRTLELFTEFHEGNHTIDVAGEQLYTMAFGCAQTHKHKHDAALLRIELLSYNALGLPYTDFSLQFHMRCGRGSREPVGRIGSDAFILASPGAVSDSSSSSPHVIVKCPTPFPGGTTHIFSPPHILSDSFVSNYRVLHWATMHASGNYTDYCIQVGALLYVEQPDEKGACPNPMSWLITKTLGELYQDRDPSRTFECMDTAGEDIARLLRSTDRHICSNTANLKVHKRYYKMSQEVWAHYVDVACQEEWPDWVVEDGMSVELYPLEGTRCMPMRPLPNSAELDVDPLLGVAPCLTATFRIHFVALR